MHVKEVGKSSMLHNIYSTIVSFLTEQEKLQKKKSFESSSQLFRMSRLLMECEAPSPVRKRKNKSYNFIS